jgi:hypothetical protein
MNKGFVILAQNTNKIDYVLCAEVLAKSIKDNVPNSSVTLISNNKSSSIYFDNIVPLPYGDLAPDSDWKLINDWQIYEASPYDYTIKIEADIYIPTNIDYWWDILSEHDLVVCDTIRNFKNEISTNNAYRDFIVTNNLPNVYNALTYFKKSKTSEDFFNIVRDVFENWEDYKELFKCDSLKQATTDWAYSIACMIVGVENSTLPNFQAFSMIHMKKWINYLRSEDWTQELIYECNDTLKINTFPQLYPFHYHIKDFSKVLKEYYG